MGKSLKQKAGIVAHRCEHGDEPLVLVITSRKHKDTWVFPVGSVKQGESLEAAAKRECAEEAGYHVEVGQRLTTVEVPQGHKTKRFTFFLATVVGEAAQWETDRRREWLPVSQAGEVVSDVFRSVAREAAERLMEMNSQ